MTVRFLDRRFALMRPMLNFHSIADLYRHLFYGKDLSGNSSSDPAGSLMFRPRGPTDKSLAGKTKGGSSSTTTRPVATNKPAQGAKPKPSTNPAPVKGNNTTSGGGRR
ncbi:hypothetical protein MVEN_02226700 [Mycena venus]|uniref:Uncharacterized protein n=1 Tax=Mycena venus TaxID=2733690 RepID=A0A8H7CH26_9AGAR|nr:hypothetical protein MVEN_02226700 [Mycena venus]